MAGVSLRALPQLESGPAAMCSASAFLDLSNRLIGPFPSSTPSPASLTPRLIPIPDGACGLVWLLLSPIA